MLDKDHGLSQRDRRNRTPSPVKKPSQRGHLSYSPQVRRVRDASPTKMRIIDRPLREASPARGRSIERSAREASARARRKGSPEDFELVNGSPEKCKKTSTKSKKGRKNRGWMCNPFRRKQYKITSPKTGVPVREGFSPNKSQEKNKDRARRKGSPPGEFEMVSGSPEKKARKNRG
jgi:hypothetical protein